MAYEIIDENTVKETKTIENTIDVKSIRNQLTEKKSRLTAMKLVTNQAKIDYWDNTFIEKTKSEIVELKKQLTNYGYVIQ